MEETIGYGGWDAIETGDYSLLMGAILSKGLNLLSYVADGSPNSETGRGEMVRRIFRSAGGVLVSLSIVLAGVGGFVPAAAGSSGSKARLGLDDSVFWADRQPSAAEAPLIELPDVLGDRSVSPCAEGDCIDYELQLLERGARLRVGIDTPGCESSIRAHLLDPTGRKRGGIDTCYSAEMFVKDPSKGTWTLRVWPGGDGAPYRMRAKLEGTAKRSGERRRLLPNLKVEPPSEFTFSTQSIAGLKAEAGDSCHQEEILEDSAQRCLRFTVGPQNAGVGPLELKFDRLDGTDASMRQRVYFSDGSSEMRDAGESEFHKTHQHFHLKGFARFDLYRVTDRQTGALRIAGQGNKAGFCLVDYKIVQWRRFKQEPAYSARSNCMPVGGEAELGLSAGWTDLYGYDLPGNYVDFKDNGDGYYVLAVEVDSHGYIRESNERDNHGYAYIRIKNGQIAVLERGQGRDPWDPKKTVVSDWWRS